LSDLATNLADADAHLVKSLALTIWNVLIENVHADTRCLA
jgi:hypothetical protein